MSTEANKPKTGTALIIGAGPAGLTAALELTRQSNIKPIVLEADSLVGGISRTVNYKGNRIDIGGHRFFSKSDWVMQWWQEILPLEEQSDRSNTGSHQQERPHTAVSADPDAVMLVRHRLSRIYYEGHYFDYPVKLNVTTIKNLGLLRIATIGLSYLKAMAFPLKEKNLEDFLINRFGKKLYETFFKSYTEKVWGVACNAISPEWGAQRIKGLSISKALLHFIMSPFKNKNISDQRKNETSLIERFLYPKFGPGQMWETVAHAVIEAGGEIKLKHRATHLKIDDNNVVEVSASDESGNTVTYTADWIISTMPVRELIQDMDTNIPPEMRKIAEGLPYRDFLTVGLLVKKMQPNTQSAATADNHMPPDNWIYIQDPSVRLGRLQIFNNWSPDMVAQSDNIWLGLEYFCDEGDDLWEMPDEELKRFAAEELARINLISTQDVIDGVVIRMPKAYPAYFGTYNHFHELQEYTDTISNLYLIGRNGMHRYNNQDHSMLAAKACVEAIVQGKRNQEKLWNINVEEEYHEER